MLVVKIKEKTKLSIVPNVDDFKVVDSEIIMQKDGYDELKLKLNDIESYIVYSCGLVIEEYTA